MGDARLDAAEARRPQAQAHAVHRGLARRPAALKLERQHRAESVEDPLSDVVGGVRGEPGVDDALHPRMGLEELCDPHRVLARALDPEVERADAAAHEPCGVG